VHVGLGVFFQGLRPELDDHTVCRDQLALADRAEGERFQSLWTAEHHFTRYHMMPNPAQFLTYMAGRTRALRLGTMVMVLPWHDPVRVAEEIAWVDSVSRGRVILGLGRGLGPVEFDGFRLDMAESRPRFVEYATAVSEALETGVIRSAGPLYVQPPAALHPPAFASFRGRTYASAVSPESAPIMARLGYGLMLIAQKPWETTVAETEHYRRLFREFNGHEPPQPILVNFTTVHPDGARAGAWHDEYTMAYARSTVEHYEFGNPRLESVPGYEYYAGLRRNIAKHGTGRFNRFLADLPITGTTDEVVEATADRVRALNAGGVVTVLSFGGMPAEVAEANFTTYAREVLPRLQGIDPARDIGRPIPTAPTVPVP
jgi:alkanesulfonate monooxygenase SsuD/methylene tetrahydromethanopterin reductase-like flavin-dependent oxidoreductase (luciferase family)